MSEKALCMSTEACQKRGISYVKEGYTLVCQKRPVYPKERHIECIDTYTHRHTGTQTHRHTDPLSLIRTHTTATYAEGCHIHRTSSLYLPLGSVNLVLKVMGTPDEISSPPG